MIRRKRLGFASLTVGAVFAALLCGSSSGLADSILGTAQSFAVLGGQSVTNTGSTTINGDLGVSPGTSITGAGSITITGSYADNNQPAQQAQADETTAYNSLKALSGATNLSGQNLGSVGTLSPGVFSFGSSAQLTGTLTLNFGDVGNESFVFQIGSTLTTASDASVVVENGAANDSVYFQVGSSATLGSGTAFEGNILALASVTLDSTATILCGRAFAQTGSVTMISNTISDNCANGGNYDSGISDFGSIGLSGGPSTPPTPTPEPATIFLFGSALLGLVVLHREVFFGGAGCACRQA